MCCLSNIHQRTVLPWAGDRERGRGKRPEHRLARAFLCPHVHFALQRLLHAKWELGLGWGPGLFFMWQVMNSCLPAGVVLGDLCKGSAWRWSFMGEVFSAREAEL